MAYSVCVLELSAQIIFASLFDFMVCLDSIALTYASKSFVSIAGSAKSKTGFDGLGPKK